jgi:hypothetical protein
MSIEKPTTMEQQWLQMTAQCIKAGVSTTFMLAAIERARSTETGLATETTVADVLATSRSIADNGPQTGVRRRRAAAKTRSSSR